MNNGAQNERCEDYTHSLRVSSINNGYFHQNLRLSDCAYASVIVGESGEQTRFVSAKVLVRVRLVFWTKWMSLIVGCLGCWSWVGWRGSVKGEEKGQEGFVRYRQTEFMVG